MLTIRYFAFIASYFFLVCASKAQSSTLYFQHLGKNEGLIDNSYNTFLTKDSRNFLWISSMQGCYRFDGISVKQYPLPPLKSGEELLQNIQSDFWEDAHGNLWFASFSALHCYNRKNDKIKSIRLVQGRSVLKDNYHVFHLERKNGILWVKSGKMVFLYNIYSGKTSSPLFETVAVRFTIDTTDSGEVKTIYACPWWNKTGLEVWTKNNTNEWGSSSMLDDVLANANISKAIIGKDKTTWLISNIGLIALSSLPRTQLKLYRPTEVRGDFHCWDGTSWEFDQHLIISARENGLWSFDPVQRVFSQNWRSNTSFPYTLSTNNPISIYNSHDQELWVSHNHVGIDYTKFTAAPFFNPLKDVTTGTVRVKIIVEDPKQRIWVLTEKHGVLVFNSNGVLIQHYGKNKNDQKLTSFSHLSIDSTGVIWALSNEGIFRFPFFDKVKNGKWEMVYAMKNRPISIFPETKNKAWVITNTGVFNLSVSNGNYNLKPAQEFSKYHSFEFIRFIKAGIQTIFIPFESQSLWIASRKKEELVVTHKFSELVGETYSAQSSRKTDTTWVATEKGLYGYSKGKLFLILGNAQFDGPCSIYGVVEDEGQCLWLSSNRGLWCYNRRTEKLLHLSQADGLESETFTPGAALWASNGKIWFGTDKGLIVFHSDSIHKEFPVPRAHIEALWVNNSPYEPGYSIGETNSIELSYLQNTLTFELKAIGYYQPKASFLKFRLLGYDKHWATVPNGGYARFTKVPPGHYKLEILPLNANGQSGSIHVLSIDIRPPFWQTLWFKIISILLALLFVISIVGLYYRRKLREQRVLLERQQALSDERNRIAKELHDDMGSSLSSIIFLSEDLLMDDNPAQKREINRIFSLAEHSLENMREIIWAMDTGKNTLQDLSIRLRTLATELLTDNKVPFELDFPLTPLDQYVLGGECRRNTYLIIKEALHNTIKHAKASMVKVSLKLDGLFVVMEIQDDGLGFDEHLPTAVGHGIINMRDRAKAIKGTLMVNSNPGEGTLLRLRVPL